MSLLSAAAHTRCLTAERLEEWQAHVAALAVDGERISELFLPSPVLCDGRTSAVIAVDLDATLFPLLSALSGLPGATPIDSSQVNDWEWLENHYGSAAALGDALTAAMHIDHARGFAPFDQAREQMQRLVEVFNVRLMVITNRPLHVVDHTRQWLTHHQLPLSGLILGATLDKVSLCADIGARALVDDTPETLDAAHQAGLYARGLRWPYNDDIHQRIGRPAASDWTDMGDALQRELLSVSVS